MRPDRRSEEVAVPRRLPRGMAPESFKRTVVVVLRAAISRPPELSEYMNPKSAVANFAQVQEYLARVALRHARYLRAFPDLIDRGRRNPAHRCCLNLSGPLTVRSGNFPYMSPPFTAPPRTR